MSWSAEDERLFAASLASAPKCGPAQMNRLAGLIGLTPVDDDIVTGGEFMNPLALGA